MKLTVEINIRFVLVFKIYLAIHSRPKHFNEKLERNFRKPHNLSVCRTTLAISPSPKGVILQSVSSVISDKIHQPTLKKLINVIVMKLKVPCIYFFLKIWNSYKFECFFHFFYLLDTVLIPTQLGLWSLNSKLGEFHLFIIFFSICVLVQ